MTRWLIIGMALGLMALAWTKPIPVDGTAAVVNDQVITVADVMATMQPVERQLRQTTHGDELNRKLEEAYENALEALIERALIIDSFNQQKELSLPDTFVNARIEEIVRNKFNNSLTELNKALEAEGLTMEEWKKNLKHSIIVSLMREREVENKIAISPQAIRDAYEKTLDSYRIPDQVELRMIVIHRGTTEQEIALKRKQADDICRHLLAGERFDDLAKRVSEGPKASDGGYVGWIDPTTRRPELADAMASLDPGEISEVITAGDDYYILKVEGRKHGTVIPFEKAQETIRPELHRKEAKRLYDAWIERLKKNAYIQKY